MGTPWSSRLRVGVLPPASNVVPCLAGDLLTAVEFGFAEAGLDADVVAEFAGYNEDAKAVLPVVQQLLIARRVACVVAPLNVSLIEKLGGTFQSQSVPLVALSLGEDALFDTARSPYVFVNTFQLWRAAWMCGYLGAQRFGPRAATLASLHEGGYGLTFAFQLGLEAAGGGLLQAAVTHRTSSTEDPSSTITDVASRDPDFIWAAYSGKEAVSFLAAYDASGCRQKIPVLGLPPLVDDYVRAAAGGATLGTYVVTPDPPAPDAGGGTATLAQAIGRPPHPYALLAYESAHPIAAAVRAAGGPDKVPGELPQRLREAEFQGPRGLTRFDDGVEMARPLYLRQVTADGDSIEEVEAPPLLDEQCALARTRLVKQGWVNPYLCA